MAKPLREPPPSSSVARLFNAESAARALAVPENNEPFSIPQPSPNADRVARSETGNASFSGQVEYPRQVKREFVLTTPTDETLNRLLQLYRRSTGSRLSSSHLMRALLKGVEHCMTSIEREAARIGRLRLPANAKDREREREVFEKKLAQALVAGIRAAAAYELTDN